MAVYRFRLIFEDNEDVLREIDILGKQTFEDLHRAVQEAISFDGSKDASFFVSDDLWRKGMEIASNPVVYDEDDETPKHKRKVVKKMTGAKIADHIDDPHQRFVYVTDPEVKWTLLVELVKIDKDDPKVNYPKCTKSSGAAPKQYKQVIVPPVVDEEEEDEEEDKTAKEKIFTHEVAYDSADHDGAEEHGEEGEPIGDVEGESESEGEVESEEEAGEDFDAAAFGSDGDDF
ncbi:MAG TPA: hypothetical protein VL651_05140 [Bacteroidia bacterium]|jgi:hypothetical protein|nr:hypothetical protein [Bacteroidia bacterium]